MADAQHKRFKTIMTVLYLAIALLGIAALLRDEILFGVIYLVGSGLVFFALWPARNLPPPRQTDHNEKEVAR